MPGPEQSTKNTGGIAGLKKPRRERWEMMKQEKEGEAMMSLARGALHERDRGSHVAMSSGALESKFRTLERGRI